MTPRLLRAEYARHAAARHRPIPSTDPGLTPDAADEPQPKPMWMGLDLPDDLTGRYGEVPS